MDSNIKEENTCDAWKIVIHVEVGVSSTSKLGEDQFIALVQPIIHKDLTALQLTEEFRNVLIPPATYSQISQHVKSIGLYKEYTMSLSTEKSQSPGKVEHCSNLDTLEPIVSSVPKTVFYVYSLADEEPEEAFMDSDDEDGNDSPSSYQWALPSKAFDGLWDALFFDSFIKSRLQDYVRTALYFASKGVDRNLVTWNKVILLHGPPGCGKTSLCKALAQKTTIRLVKSYRHGQLIEINSHSLFSKWFSESGKLVMRMFDRIHQTIQDTRALVFLLIDEVESLANCRQNSSAANEPTDTIRAVNALLTQLDKIKRYPNVLILTTSNLVKNLDGAFVDRADLKILIPIPSTEVVYRIYMSSLNELMKVGVIQSSNSLSETASNESTQSTSTSLTNKLSEISRKSVNLSGRTLRRIPFLAHSNFINNYSCTLEKFLDAMNKTVEIEQKEILSLEK